MQKRVLIVTPWIPYPITGADQQDRFQGFLQLKNTGYDIRVIAKIHAFQDRKKVETFYADAGIALTLIPYCRSHVLLLFRRIGRIFCEPALLDGAALEYTDDATEQAVRDAVSIFKPDVAWVEFTFLWPVVRLLRSLHIPVVMRSANNEAQQSIDEHGGRFFPRIISIPKFRSERIAARESSVVCAITPWEKKWYEHCGSKQVMVLPLRGLGRTLRTHKHTDKKILDVVFLSSSYSNGHNRDALHFVLTQIAPLIRKRAPGEFRFHITGKKFPEEFRQFLTSDVVVHDFIPDLDHFLDTTDIALCPSVSGQGMQQKIFEPLCCGLPLITHHTAGYPFEDGVHVLLADTAERYVEHLLHVRASKVRQQLADHAHTLSAKIFSDAAMRSIATDALETAISISSKAHL